MLELKVDPGLRVIEESLSQIDSQNRVNFIQIFSNDSKSRVKF